MARKQRAAEDTTDPVVAAEKKTLIIGGLTVKPYTVDEDLPEPVMGKRGRVKKPGEPRFTISRRGEVVEFVAVYRNGKGVARRLVKALKPEKNGNDKALLSRIRAAGVTEN